MPAKRKTGKSSPKRSSAEPSTAHSASSAKGKEIVHVFPRGLELIRNEHAANIELRRRDPATWIELLESLLLDAEDIALARGEWGLCDSLPRTEHVKDRYQSMTCAVVIDNIRARKVKR